MVGGELLLTAILGVLGLAGTGAGFLYRRDAHQQTDIDGNAEAINELDTSFARLTTRLFGHPDDRADHGVITERGQRVEQAEEHIDSLQEQVEEVKATTEETGETVESIDQRVTEHAQQTRSALRRIEEHLDDSVIAEDDFTRGGGD